MARGKSNQRTTRNIATLEARLADLQNTLDAIRSGAVDALVVSGPEGDQLFTPKGAGDSYRVLVEGMNTGPVEGGGGGSGAAGLGGYWPGVRAGHHNHSGLRVEASAGGFFPCPKRGPDERFGGVGVLDARSAAGPWTLTQQAQYGLPGDTSEVI